MDLKDQVVQEMVVTVDSPVLVMEVSLATMQHKVQVIIQKHLVMGVL